MNYIYKYSEFLNENVDPIGEENEIGFRVGDKVVVLNYTGLDPAEIQFFKSQQIHTISEIKNGKVKIKGGRNKLYLPRRFDLFVDDRFENWKD